MNNMHCLPCIQSRQPPGTQGGRPRDLQSGNRHLRAFKPNNTGERREQWQHTVRYCACPVSISLTPLSLSLALHSAISLSISCIHTLGCSLSLSLTLVLSLSLTLVLSLSLFLSLSVVLSASCRLLPSLSIHCALSLSPFHFPFYQFITHSRSLFLVNTQIAQAPFKMHYHCNCLLRNMAIRAFHDLN